MGTAMTDKEYWIMQKKESAKMDYFTRDCTAYGEDLEKRKAEKEKMFAVIKKAREG